MKKEYVSNELARKLKAKGCPISKAYKDDWVRPFFYDLPKEHPDWQDCDVWYVPTVEEVLLWLREEKKIYVVVTPYPSMSTKDKVVWCYQIKHNSDGAFMEEVDGAETYMFYRRAALEGIKYVIDKLI
jgi:hypothetical protein